MSEATVEHTGTTSRPWVPWAMLGVALVGCTWLAAIINDWLLGQLLPLLTLGLDDPVPFVLAPYALPPLLATVAAVLGWWSTCPGGRPSRVRWVGSRVLGCTGWLLLGLVVSAAVDKLVSVGLARVVEPAPVSSYERPLSSVVPTVVAATLLLLALVVSPTGTAGDAQRPGAAARTRGVVDGIALLGSSWTASVTYGLLLVVALPWVRGEDAAGSDVVPRLFVELGLALAVTVLARVADPLTRRDDARVRQVGSAVLETVGWVLVGVAVYQLAWSASTFGLDGPLAMPGMAGLGLDSWLAPMLLGVGAALAGRAVRPRPADVSVMA